MFLVFLAGELILIAGKLLYAAPHDGKIKRHGFKLRLQFCRSYGPGGEAGSNQPSDGAQALTISPP
jgi:hypothetical protein